MAGRPTIADVAREAGVSVATVDRVLNGRLPVKEQTARRVAEAAAALGFHATSLIETRSRAALPEYRLGFLLQHPEQAFYQQFARQAEAAVTGASRFRGRAIVAHWTRQEPEEIVATLERLARSCHAVGLVSPDHPTVSAAIERLKSRGIPVLALLSDVAAGIRHGYVGLDNRKVGRTAAWMIARAALRPGRVAVFVGSPRFTGHELREIGLRSYFREEAPDFTVLETRVNLETPEVTRQTLISIMGENPDLAGCYVSGGGMEGAIDALRSLRLARPPVLVVNELTPELRAGLAENLVTMAIGTPLPELCRSAVDIMAQAVEDGAAASPGQTFLPFDIHLPETI